MNKINYSFLVTSIAGLSTLIGYLMIFIKGDKDKIIAFSLAFSSSVMLTISTIDLIPSSLSYLNNYMIIFRILLFLFFFNIGIFLSYFISLKIEEKNFNSLKKIGIISMIAIILHNIPEGIITFMVSGVDIRLGISLAIAIGMHNIPEGISIAIPYYYATHKNLKTFFMVFLAGFSEILGAMLCYCFFKNIINDLIIGVFLSLTSGIMIYISINELIPKSLSYQNKKILVLGFFLGFIVMLLSHLAF